MKVILLGTAYPYRGGLASYNERLAREFLAQGHSVQIYTFTLQYPDFLFPGTTQYSTSPPPSDLFIVRKVNSINPLNWWKVGREIAALAPDLLIMKYWLPFMAPCFGTIARLAKRNKKTKVVAVIDNIIPHEKRFADRMLSNYFVGSIDGFIAQSKSVLEDLKTFDEHKPTLFSPHPLFDNFGEKPNKAEAIEKLGLEMNGQYLLFFGFIRDYKGLDLLLEAMADSRIYDSYTQLIIAGEFYNNAEKYMELIREKKLHQKVILRTDFIPDEMVRYYFSAADMVVQPYKHATQSGVTQICYHFNRPMLVTNVGGLPEIVPDGIVGYVTDPNPTAIADAVDDFYTHHKEYLFVENIKIEKNKFTWATMINNIKKVAEIA